MSWEQLVDQAHEAAEERRQANSQPPVACPNDGEPLVERRGVWHCPGGDYEWPRDGMRSGIDHTP